MLLIFLFYFVFNHCGFRDVFQLCHLSCVWALNTNPSCRSWTTLKILLKMNFTTLKYHFSDNIYITRLHYTSSWWVSSHHGCKSFIDCLPLFYMVFYISFNQSKFSNLLRFGWQLLEDMSLFNLSFLHSSLLCAT